MFHAATRFVRLPVSCMVAVSSGFGYLLVHPVADMHLALVCLGTFCLAAACSTLNQIQERDTDALLTRTASRPLPSGSISVTAACITAFAFACASATFFVLLKPELLYLGAMIVVLYNGVYTPLKRRTGFALLIGAIPGAMPPVMGWVAAGGHLDMGIGFVFVVYYLWQVPHFWLRVERDRHEYALAGLPIPILSFGEERYRRLLRVWFYAYVVAILMTPLFVHMQSSVMRIAATFFALMLFIVPGCYLLYRRQHDHVFHWVNMSILLVMLIVLTDRLMQTQMLI